MKNSDKRSIEIINAAEKAVSKIANPKLRAKATAELKTIQKKLAEATRRSRPAASRPQRARDRDLDFDR